MSDVRPILSKVRNVLLREARRHDDIAREAAFDLQTNKAPVNRAVADALRAVDRAIEEGTDEPA